MKKLVLIAIAVLVSASTVIPSFSQVAARKGAAPAAPKAPVTATAPVKKPVPTPTPAPAAKPAAPSPDNLASGSYIVYAQATQVLRVMSDSKKMKNLNVVGKFTVTDGEDGGNKELEVFVFDEDNYNKFKDEKAPAKADPAKAAPATPAAPAKATEPVVPAKPIYSSGKKTSGDFTVALPNAGIYYVVFSNKSATTGKKTFTVDVNLKYEKP